MSFNEMGDNLRISKEYVEHISHENLAKWVPSETSSRSQISRKWYETETSPEAKNKLKTCIILL